MENRHIRPRILYLVDALDHDYQSEVTRGVVRGARRHDAELVILVGGQMVFTNRHLKHRKFIYELPKPADFDGVVFLGTTLSSHEGRAAIAPLVMRFASLPAASIGLDIGRGSTVLVDNADGMTRVTEHLLEVHGCKRFVYISGPTANKEAQMRLKAFKETLSKRQLNLRPEHLLVGAFTEASGEAAIVELLDHRQVDIASVDAIVAANDSMAVGAMDELARRGIEAPRDLAIVGFDDIEAARYGKTPLTTIQQPLSMQGERAVQRIIGSGGSHESGTVTISPKLVVRRSCGCGRSFTSLNVQPSQPPSSTEPIEQAIERKRSKIERDIVRAAELGGMVGGWEELLVTAVIDALSGKQETAVTELIEGLVRQSVEAGERLHTWTAVLTVLDRHLGLLVEAGTQASARVEAVMHRARVAMSEAAEQYHATKNRELVNRTVAFNETAAALLTSLDDESFAEAAAAHVPRLGIHTFSISLFEGQTSAGDALNPFVVMKNGERLEKGASYPSHHLAPPVLTEGRPFALVIEPLCFHDDIYGLAALEYEPTEGGIYEQLGAFFSASLKAIHMSEESVRTKELLETSAIYDPLTGAFNKRHLETRLVEEIARVKMHHRPLSVLAIGMDNFGVLNKTLGEKSGDQALIEVAKTLGEATHLTEIVARYDDDRFVILLPETDADAALEIANRLNRNLKFKLTMPFQGLISTSIGIATVDGGSETTQDTPLKSALLALSNSKNLGKDTVTHARDLHR